MNKKLGYRDLLSEKNYLKQLIANVVNRFGDSIDAMAFAWMVYEVTGQRAWSAIIFGLNSLPSILFMPFAGVWVERIDKKRIMVLTDFGRAILVSVVAFLYMTDNISVFILACSTLLMSTFEAFRIPAGMGIYPEIVPREKYTIATSFSQTFSNLASLIGMAVFGIIIATTGLQGAMFINAGTFLISAIFISTLKLSKKVANVSEIKFFHEMKEGLSYLYTKKVVFLICAVGSLLGVFFLPINSLMTPYVKESLKLGENALSAFSTAFLSGTILGTFFFPKINNKFSKVTLFVTGGIIVAITYVAFVGVSFLSTVSLVYFSLVSFAFIFGFGSSFISIVVNVAFMEHVEKDYLSRVGAIFNAIAQALTPVASFALAALAAFLTVNQIFFVSGIATIVIFIVLSFNRTFKSIDRGNENELEGNG